MSTHQSEDILDQRLDKLRQSLDELAAIIDANARRNQRRRQEVKLLFPFSLLAAAIDTGFKRLEQGTHGFVQRVIGSWIDRIRRR